MATVGSNLGGILIKHCTGRITSTMRAAFRMLNVGTDGTQEATKFINTDANINQGIAKVTSLYIGSGAGTQVVATVDEINQAADLSFKGEILTSSTEAVTAADNGKIFFLDRALGIDVTLPTLSTVFKGWHCEFFVKTAPSGGTYKIEEETGTDTDKMYAYSKEGVIADTVDHPSDTTHTDATFADGVAIRGDRMVVETDGVLWFVQGYAAATGGITLA